MSGPLATLLAVAAYGALHSLLAAPAAKRLAERGLGPAVRRGYRLAYNIVGVITLLPVLAVVALEPGALIYRLRLPWSALALAVQALGLAVLVAGLLQTDALHFLGLRQLVEHDPRPARLVVSGLYRHVRHPLYTAGLAVLWFTPLLTASLLAFNLGLTAYIGIGSHFEERRLHAEFGPAYAEYARRVPRLLPRLGPLSNSD